MSKIFGGSKSKSKNVNNSLVTNALSPLMGQAVNANNRANAFLGGDTAEFSKFAEAAGMPFEAMRGVDALGSQFAGRNVFRSGARDKAIAEFGQGLSSRYSQQYLQSLLGQGQQGLSAAGLIANVGQQSTSKSKPGLSGLVGGAASIAAGGFGG